MDGLHMMWLAGAVSFLLLIPCARTTFGSEKKPSDQSGKCLEAWTIDKGDSYLGEVRGKYFHMPDWQEVFGTEKIEGDNFIPIERTANFKLHDKPILWYAKDKKAVVVSKEDFTEMKVADITRIAYFKKIDIGRFLGWSSKAISGRELVKFLIAADIIRTYVHVESNVCLIEESDTTQGGYKAHFTGSHIYFTNERNEDSFAFIVDIDPEGRIVVTAP